MKKILVIDDEKLNRKLIIKAIEGSHHEAIEAKNGTEGIELVQKEMPDLILLDLAMPDIDGIEVCKRMKKIDNIKDIPVIMLSAMSDKELIYLAIKAGAVDYIVKPLKTAELIKKLDEL